MKVKVQTGRKIMLMAATVIVLITAVYCVLRFGFSIDILDRSGWKTENGSVQYLDYHGKPLTGWQEIGENRYYFDPQSGNIATGWVQIGSDLHYLGEDGIPGAGWLSLDGKHYFLEENGKTLAGWQQLDNQLYYFSQDGSALTGWQNIDSQCYCFSDTGAALIGWQNIDGKTYYFSESGQALSGWAEVDGTQYLFTDEGARYTGWLTDDTGTRFFNQDGLLHTGWLEWEGNQYYFGDDNLMRTGWLELDAEQYYLLPDGKMAVGEVDIDGVSHFFTSRGKWVLLVNPWHALPPGYTTDLVDLEGYSVDRQCRDPLMTMMEDCRKAGFNCYINNTYRSVATQQYMWDVRLERHTASGMSYDAAVAYIGQSLAIPGHSEHHTGLAVDILGTQGMYDWLAQHCWDYGFILRYPDNKMSVTGIIFEPWHFRYVGTELSLELKELELCMEEYMAMLTDCRGQRSAKDKQIEPVGVQRYGRVRFVQ